MPNSVITALPSRPLSHIEGAHGAVQTGSTTQARGKMLCASRNIARLDEGSDRGDPDGLSARTRLEATSFTSSAGPRATASAEQLLATARPIAASDFGGAHRDARKGAREGVRVSTTAVADRDPSEAPPA